MKVRLISSAVGLIVLAVVICFYDTVFLNAVLCLICSIAIFELIKTVGLGRHFALAAISFLYCAAIMFMNTPPVASIFLAISCVYIVFVFCYALKCYNKVDIRDLCFIVFFTFLLSAAFNCIVRMRDLTTPQTGLFYALIILGSAWWNDAGAYFVGVFFGKTKLCPHISPKKTVEGLVGGILSAIVGNILVSVIFVKLSSAIVPFGYFSSEISVNYLRVLLVTPLLAVLGVIGDLTASLVKRNFSVKDFGSIMPGHGGIMDRFDSVLLISAAVYVIFNIFPLISVI